MKQVLLVVLGGCVSSVLRYKLGGWVLHHTLEWRFPAGIFGVNVVGCTMAGMIAGLIERQNFFSADTRLFLLTGFLGGFTTFSAFGLDVVFLKRGEAWVAIAYVLLSVVVGVGALWLTMSVVPHAKQ